LKESGAKKKKEQDNQGAGYPIYISVNGNDNMIEIKVDKSGITQTKHE